MLAGGDLHVAVEAHSDNTECAGEKERQKTDFWFSNAATALGEEYDKPVRQVADQKRRENNVDDTANLNVANVAASPAVWRGEDDTRVSGRMYNRRN